MLNSLLEQVWSLSWQAAIVAVFVLMLRIAFGQLVTPRWRHALWLLVLGRLLIPVLPESRVSLFTIAELFRSPASARVVTPIENPAHTVRSSIVYGFGPAKQTFTPMQIIEQPIPWWQRPGVIQAAWLTIALAILARQIFINMGFSRRLQNNWQQPPGHLIALLDRCRREMGLSRGPRLMITDAVEAPAVCGAFWHRVLLPADQAEYLSQAQLRLVFLHELAHIKCRDVAIDWVWAIVQAFHWFNPLLWLIGPLRRSDREQARDEMVLNITGPSQAQEYGQTLLDLAHLSQPPLLCPGLVGIVSGKRRLQRRIKMIAGFQNSKNGWIGLALLAVAGSCTLTNPRTTPIKSAATTMPAPRASTNDVAAKLDQRVPELKFDKTPFSQAIESLGNISGVNIYVDWTGLAKVGVNRETPVTAKFRSIRLSKVLQLIFKSVELDGEDRRLGYAVDDGVITITTQKELDKSVETRGYDVNDLMFTPPMDDPAKQQQFRSQRVAEITRYITDNVATTSWKDNGGTTGAIFASPLRGVLLITTTRDNHGKVQAVLDSLRSNNATATAPATTQAFDDRLVETRRYDFNDLLFIPPDFHETPPTAMDERIADLKTYIQDNATHSSWKNRDGGVGTIEVDQTKRCFVITQTSAAHREIQQVLDSLRQNRSLQISLQTRIVTLDDDDLRAMPEAVRQHLAAVSSAGKNRVDQLLTVDEYRQLMRYIQSSKSTMCLTAPRLTMFDHQHAELKVDTQQAYVESLSAVMQTVNGKAVESLEPHVGTVDQQGLDMHAAVCDSLDHSSVFVELQIKIPRLLALVPQTITSPTGLKGTVQHPVTVTYERSVTCAVPDRSTLLIGGFTQTFSDPPNPTAAMAAEKNIEHAHHQQMYLLVTPTILKQVQTSASFPMLAAP